MVVSVVRDFDGQVFLREYEGGLLCSGYPPIAKPAFVDEIPEDLKANRLPEDWDYFSEPVLHVFSTCLIIINGDDGYGRWQSVQELQLYRKSKSVGLVGWLAATLTLSVTVAMTTAP